MTTMLRDPYCQCVLHRDTAVGYHATTSYIPAEFAVPGRKLKLRNDDGEWEGGWYVVSASAPRERPTSPHEQIKNHRRATGDSGPR